MGHRRYRQGRRITADLRHPRRVRVLLRHPSQHESLAYSPLTSHRNNYSGITRNANPKTQKQTVPTRGGIPMPASTIVVGKTQIIGLLDTYMEFPWNVFMPSVSRADIDRYRDLYPGSFGGENFRTRAGAY